MKINKISIVGMGALGILYGDFFTQKLGKERVEFVMDRARLKVSKRGRLLQRQTL